MQKTTRKNIESSKVKGTLVADITTVLLNWHRPENMKSIIPTIKNQTIESEIWVWNNGEPLNMPDIDLEVIASKNVGCWPRHLLAGFTQSDYIITFDDDIMPSDNKVFEDIIRIVDQHTDTIIGLFGVQLRPGHSYRASKHVHRPTQDTWVDLLKNRFMAFRRDILIDVPINAWNQLYDEDIALCGMISGGARNKFFIPAALRTRFKELSRGKDSVSGNPGHYERRDEVTRLFFGNW